jgi:hypothetical protein
MKQFGIVTRQSRARASAFLSNVPANPATDLLARRFKGTCVCSSHELAECGATSSDLYRWLQTPGLAFSGVLRYRIQKAIARLQNVGR